MALITDAGTPGISDPGFFAKADFMNVAIESLPGATLLWFTRFVQVCQR
jgi:16S rRNA C1402 (ribose-2'-O) methylase RsmI